MNARKFFTLIVHNWPAKILSFGLAIFLFIFHRMTTLEEKFYYAPIVIEKLSGLVPSSSYPRMIRVNLRGEANGVHSILEDDIEIYVDMESFNVPGTYVVPVKWRKRGTAIGVEPLQITVDPVEITFSLDHRISKFVPITANFRGQVEAGFNLISYTLNPAQVIIEGPAGIIAGISELSTDMIDLEGHRSDFSLTAAILQRDPLIIVRGSGNTEFHGIISQIIPVRNISNVPIIITGVEEGLTAELEIKVGSIHLEGDNRAAVEAFIPSADFLKVDCSGVSEPGVYILKVLAGSAQGVTLRAEPREVQVTISPVASQAITGGEGP